LLEAAELAAARRRAILGLALRHLGEIGAVFELVVDLVGVRFDRSDLVGWRVRRQLEKDLRDGQLPLAGVFALVLFVVALDFLR
jgi:hypothetical protein